MNKTQKFFVNTVWAAAQQIVTILLGFIVPILMIKTYGSEVNGLITSITQCISYVSLVEAGLGGAAIYSLYLPLAKKDVPGINGIVSAAKNFYIKTGYIFSSVCTILAILFAFLKVPKQVSPYTVFVLVLLLSANGCVDFFALSRYRVILTADQRSYILSMLRIFQDIFKIIIVVICSYAKIDVVILYLLASLPIIGKIIPIYIIGRRRYPYLNFNAEPNVAALGRRYDVIYQQILGTVQMGAPVILATIFLDWVAVSVYSVYNMVIAGINGVMNIFISGLPSGFGEVIAAGDKKTLKTSASQFEVAYYMIISIVYGLTMALILPFIGIYTKDLSDAQYYLPILAFLVVINGFLYNIKTPQSMLMIAAGMYKEQRWRSTLQTVIIVGGGILLAIPYQLYGIMLASIIANVYRTLDLAFYVPKHLSGLSAMNSLRRMFQTCLNVIVIFLPTLWISLNPSGYVQWFIIAIIYAIFAVVWVISTFFLTDKKDFTALLQRIKGIFRRSK